MHPTEIEQALKSFELLVDTREQPTHSYYRRLKSMAVPLHRQKLDFGDYSARVTLADGSFYSLNDKVCVERKMSLDELCACFCRDRARFKREFERAKQAEARIYLLIENDDFDKAYKGKYRSQMKPKALISSVLAWMVRYDCRIVFCSADLSGRLIKDILYREMKERLCTFGSD